MPELEGEKISRLSFFSKPIWALVVSLTSVIGFALTVIALLVEFGGKESRELIFSVNPTKLEIVRTLQSSKLSVNYKGKSINSDITTVQVALWDGGGIPIRKEDVLKPVVIFTEPSVPILEGTIRKTSRDVIQFTLKTDEIEQGRLQVDWAILEKHDGGLIEITFAGSPDISLNVDGIIVGQTEIARYKNKIGYQSPSEEYDTLRRSNKAQRIFYPIFAIIAVIAFVFNIREMRKPKDMVLVQRTGLVILTILLPIFLMLCIAMFILSNYPSPPFGL